MDSAECVSDAADVFELTKLLGRRRASLNESRDEASLRFDDVQDFGADTYFPCSLTDGTFG